MKTKYIFLLILFILAVRPGAAQEIRVVDRATGQGISGVLIFSADTLRHTSTNENGMADLSGFLPGDLLTFRHPGYEQLHIRLTDIAGRTGTVMLQEKIIHIGEIVISANKWEQNPQEIPNELLAIKPDEILISHPQTSADLLDQTGQVFVQRSQMGGGSPMIRGFAANSVLLVVDGVRMNNAIFRSGNLQNIINIDPNMLQSAEVLFGPGSVMYGSDALGGVMDFHTLRPGFSEDGHTKVKTAVWTRYASANRELTGHAHVAVERKRFSYTGGFSYSDFSDLRTGAVRPERYPGFGKRPEYVKQINGMDSIVKNKNENVQIPSAYSTWSTLQKLGFRPGDGIELQYGFYLSKTSDIPRYDRLTEYDDGHLKYARWYYGPQNWMMNSLRMHYYKPAKWFDEFRVIAAWQQFRESRHDRKYRDPLIRHREERVNIFSLNFDLEKSWENKRHLFYGLEYTFNAVSSAAYTKNIQSGETGPARTRYPDEGSGVNAFALYASYKNELVERTYLSAGARVSFYGLDARFSPASYIYDEIKNRYGALSGSLGIVRNTINGWSLNFLISTGFRAPNIDDIAKVFDSEPGRVMVPNPDLKPEYTYNLEIRASKRIAGRVSAGGTLFYSFLRNAMVRRDFTVDGQDSIYYDGTRSRVQTLVNTGRANVYGGNVFIEADIASRWILASYLNYTQGKDLEEQVPLRHTTPLFGKTSLSYTGKSVYAECYIRYNGKRSFEDLPPSEQNKPYMYTKDGSPAWYTLNVRGNWKINRAFRIDVALENLLNRHYRPYSSGISAPDINLIITLKATF